MTYQTFEAEKRKISSQLSKLCIVLVSPTLICSEFAIYTMFGCYEDFKCQAFWWRPTKKHWEVREKKQWINHYRFKYWETSSCRDTYWLHANSTTCVILLWTVKQLRKKLLSKKYIGYYFLFFSFTSTFKPMFSVLFLKLLKQAHVHQWAYFDLRVN